MKHVPAGAFALANPSAALAAPRAIQSFRPRADGADPARILAELKKTFEDFKAENDTRLKAVEKNRDDVVTTEKVEKINSAVDELQKALDEQGKKMAALALNGGDGKPGATPEQREYASAFESFFRKGRGEQALGELAVKAALTTQSDPDGGYLAPDQMESTIDRVLMKVSAMRGLAKVQPISAGEYKKLVSQGGAGGGWAQERGARTESTTPKLSELAFEAMELYAEPSATQTILDDARIDIGQWLADEVAITFAEQEGDSFINGNGVGKPRGILNYAAVQDDSWKWGKLGYIGTGGAGFAADPAGLDALETLTYAIKKGYRVNASWLANRKTIGVVRRMKDSQGHYQWEPSSQLGQPPSLFGYPVSDDDNMPDVASNAFPVAFGDFQRGYIIVDRMGVRVLRDPYSNKPYVMFYTTKRVGGGVQNFEAIKLLKCA